MNEEKGDSWNYRIDPGYGPGPWEHSECPLFPEMME